MSARQITRKPSKVPTTSTTEDEEAIKAAEEAQGRQKLDAYVSAVDLGGALTNIATAEEFGRDERKPTAEDRQREDISTVFSLKLRPRPKWFQDMLLKNETIWYSRVQKQFMDKETRKLEWFEGIQTLDDELVVTIQYFDDDTETYNLYDVDERNDYLQSVQPVKLDSKTEQRLHKDEFQTPRYDELSRQGITHEDIKDKFKVSPEESMAAAKAAQKTASAYIKAIKKGKTHKQAMTEAKALYEKALARQDKADQGGGAAAAPSSPRTNKRAGHSHKKTLPKKARTKQGNKTLEGGGAAAEPMSPQLTQAEVAVMEARTKILNRQSIEQRRSSSSSARAAAGGGPSTEVIHVYIPNRDDFKRLAALLTSYWWVFDPKTTSDEDKRRVEDMKELLGIKKEDSAVPDKVSFVRNQGSNSFNIQIQITNKLGHMWKQQYSVTFEMHRLLDSKTHNKLYGILSKWDKASEQERTYVLYHLRIGDKTAKPDPTSLEQSLFNVVKITMIERQGERSVHQRYLVFSLTDPLEEGPEGAEESLKRTWDMQGAANVLQSLDRLKF